MKGSDDGIINQDCWVFGPCPLSDIKNNVSRTDPVLKCFIISDNGHSPKPSNPAPINQSICRDLNNFLKCYLDHTGLCVHLEMEYHYLMNRLWGCYSQIQLPSALVTPIPHLGSECHNIILKIQLPCSHVFHQLMNKNRLWTLPSWSLFHSTLCNQCSEKAILNN